MTRRSLWTKLSPSWSRADTHAAQGREHVRIRFTAFAEDSVIRGELVLEGDRLSDFIPQEGPFDIERVTLEALDDGRNVTVGATTVARSDIVAITGSGPRGNVARRVRTRPHPARMQAGPYEIVGYVHAVPSAHPFNGVLRRRVLPVTSAVIRYRLGGQSFEQELDALLVNPEKIDWLKAATDEELGVGKALEFAHKVDPHAKDLTGELAI